MFLEIVSPSEKVDSYPINHNAPLVSKEPVVINGRVFIPLNSTDTGELNAIVTRSDITRAPKAASQAWGVGDEVFWDAGDKVFTTDDDSGGNALVGHAMAPVAGGAGDTTSGLIHFNSFAA